MPPKSTVVDFANFKVDIHRNSNIKCFKKFKQKKKHIKIKPIKINPKYLKTSYALVKFSSIPTNGLCTVLTANNT